jgi:dihydrofolate reductase
MKLSEYYDVNIILATDKKFGISLSGAIPWNIPEDMQYFRVTTSVHTDDKINILLMGRKTWEYMGRRSSLNGGRKIIVITTHPERLPEGVLAARNMDEVKTILDGIDNIYKVWICGGRDIYNLFLSRGDYRVIHWNKIDADFMCDNRVFLMESAFICDSSEYVIEKKSGKTVELLYYKTPSE